MAERRSKRNIRKSAEILQLETQKEAKAHTKKVGDIWKKSASERTEDEKILLKNSSDVIKTLEQRARTREKQKQRVQEYEDNHEVLQGKCSKLAQEILKCRYVIVYTGAGISTAASIPDYRGPNGVWTLLKKGIEPGAVDLSDANPTYTHMCVSRLYAKGLVKYVVSQNCDGLHMRSGLPRNALSELHGNMFIEICSNCKPVEEHIRLFDTTERTGLRRHKTRRQCRHCGGDLKDSIVHFGEKGPFHSPYNWREASRVADQADLVLCLGSSLKVLRRYPCLWNMQKPVKERPKLVIVNLQWTPKDDLAFLKINGKCDDVMKLVMQHLSTSVPKYDRDLDPIYAYAVPLKPSEMNTVSKNILVEPPEYEKETVLRIMETLANMRVNIEYSSDEDTELTHTHSNHKTESDNTTRHVVARTCKTSNNARFGTGKSTARKSPCKLVIPRENGNCKDRVETLCELGRGKWSDDIEGNHLNSNSLLVHPLKSINNETGVPTNQQNGYTSIKSRTLHSLRTSSHCVKNMESNKDELKSMLVKCLDKETKLKNCSVVLDRNIVDDYVFQNAQENFTPSGQVKVRVLYKRTLNQSGILIPKCKGVENCGDKKESLDIIEITNQSPVSPGSARRKRSRPSRSMSTEGQGQDHSLEKKPKLDLDILGNDVFAGLVNSDSDDSLNSATIEVSIPSILKTGRKCKTASHLTQKVHNKSKADGKASRCNQNHSTDSSISNNTSQVYTQPGCSKVPSASSSGMNIPGDQALSFLAMEEACELPNLTLDSRKVWACYSSWFTALYQSLELKRDESLTPQTHTMQVDPSAIHDPEVQSTAKEQNTVLLANLAVHDLDSEQIKEQQEMLASGLSSPDVQQYTGLGIGGGGSLMYSRGGISPFHSLDRSSSLSPRAMRVVRHRNSSTSQGRDSISVSSSVASPREHHPHSHGNSTSSSISSSESLVRQPVFAESHQTSIITESGVNQSSLETNRILEDPLKGNNVTDVCTTPSQSISSNQYNALPAINNAASCVVTDLAQAVNNTASSVVTDTVQPIVQKPDSSVVTSPPVVFSPEVAAGTQYPPVIISPEPVINLIDSVDENEESDLEKKPSSIEELLQEHLHPKASTLKPIQRRSSVPATMVPSNPPQLAGTSALFAFPEGATGRGPYRPRGRPPNKPGSPTHDPNDAISRIVKQHIENIKEKTATIAETKDHVLKTMGSSAPGWFGKGCRVAKRRKKSR